MAVRIVAHRRLAFIVFTIVFLFMLHSILTTTSVINGLVYFPSFIPFTRQEQHPFSDQITNHEAEAFCTPEQYSEGYWSRRPELLLRPLIKPDDVYPISGFQGCASSREVGWHLAKSWGEDEEQRSRPWRGNASAYDWIPGRECGGYTKPTQEELVIQLVERGGWLILGDSISENHFFSLSCMLYPHVRATPDYSTNWNFDRAWQQDLFLEKSSPLVPFLRYPEGFDIDTTPLVTFRRVDLLLNKQELISIYNNTITLDGGHSPFELFSDEAVWNLDPDTYLALFRKPLPQGNYNTMIFSTGGHWTTSLFAGFHDSNVDGDGLANLILLFEKAMDKWLGQIIRTLDNVNSETSQRKTPKKRALVRAYLPGHDGCHEVSTLLNGPVRQYNSSMSHSYNWGWIRKYNDVFKSLIQRRNHSYVHFLSIENPALLRPDGHVTGDCLHILTGAGILEGWSEYISYFLKFLP